LKENSSKIHIGAVSYLNTVPLVWGMLHGPQREDVELSFSIPAVCAEELEAGKIDLGLVPVVEIARQELEIVPGIGIACLGAVRSILMFSRVPWRRIRTLAGDLSSRTSVQLARIILRERFGVEPEITAREPNLEKMLAVSDAALIIGDPALRIMPENLPFEHLDLGSEWFAWTGLPMIFAAWAGKPGIPVERLSTITRGSYEFGRAHLAEIVTQECVRRSLTKELANQYLSRHIRFELGAPEQKGLEAFLELAGLGKRELAEPGVIKPV
jgi:chorismate dehydratase